MVGGLAFGTSVGAGIFGAGIGLILSESLGIWGGTNAQLTAMSGVALIIIVLLLIMVYKKYNAVALIMFIEISPIFIGIIGAYLDNLYIMVGSTILFFLVPLVIIKYLNKKKNHYNC